MHLITDKTLVFIPSMAVHNFELSEKKKSWQILQFSPLLFSLLGLAEQATALSAPHIIYLNDKQFEQYVVLLTWLHDNNERDDLMNNDLLKLLLRNLSKQVGQCSKETMPVSTTATHERLLPLLEFIRQQKINNLNLEQAASLCNLSPSYFSRYFKKVFRQNFTQYMLTYRLHLASHYLRNSDKSITTICYELNFSHPSYFIAKFKKYFGLTPRQFRLK